MDAGGWPARWTKSRELRSWGSARAFHCRDAAGESALVVQSAETEKLERAREAHASIDAPHIARVIDASTSGDEGYLVFACDAVTDLEALVSTAVDRGVQAPYVVGIAFNEMMMDTVEAAHASGSGPWCLGELAWSNILIGPTGHCWVFGLGHNFAVRGEDGALRHGGGLCQAPDVLLGMAPSPASDVWVLHAMLRRLLPYVKILDVLTGAIGGARPELRELRAALITLDEDAQATDPAARPQSLAGLRARYREIRRLAGDMPPPDDAALRVFFAELIAASGSPAGVRLLVDVNARRLEVPGLPHIDLSRRHVLWRIVERLLEERRALPGRAVELDRLREAAWPGERMLPEAARARVYVAISTLRKLGLGDVIIKRDEGYAISPDVGI